MGRILCLYLFENTEGQVSDCNCAATSGCEMSCTAGSKSIGILGTGRLGSHMACAWAASGHRVILGSRDSLKAQAIVLQILSATGYTGNGGERTPPFAGADKAQLTGGDYETAASADIIVLATPFPATADLLAKLKPRLSGKIIIDATNPFYSGRGLPPGQPFDSAVEYHRNALNDPSTRWAVGYKTVYWHTIVPNSTGISFDTCGDEEAKQVIKQIAESHGATVRDRGGFDQASALEPGRRR